MPKCIVDVKKEAGAMPDGDVYGRNVSRGWKHVARLIIGHDGDADNPEIGHSHAWERAQKGRVTGI